MRPKKKNQFADVVDASLDGLLSEETAAPDKKDKPHNVVDKRLEKMNKLAEEKSSRRGTPATSVIRRYVKPSMCRMWDQHNRRYDLLNEHRCMDLITDVRAKGQQLPAIVRELHDDSEYIYEVVCGARRHWVAAFLGIDYFIEVRQMTDEEAFLLADSENRAREDISDYERGIDYSRALARYYKSVRQMAAALDVSDTWLGKFLALAKLPDEILEAYPTLYDVKVEHARKLCKLVDDKDTHDAIIEKAMALKGFGKPGAVVFRELCSVAKAPRSGRGGRLVEKTYQHNGKDAVVYKKTSRGGVQLTLHKSSGASKEDMENLLLRAFQEQWE
jgi:ParB family chromosome partitioning protein